MNLGLFLSFSSSASSRAGPADWLEIWVQQRVGDDGGSRGGTGRSWHVGRPDDHDGFDSRGCGGSFLPFDENGGKVFVVRPR